MKTIDPGVLAARMERRKAYDKAYHAKHRARRTAAINERVAAVAVKEGREPGRIGAPMKTSDDEKRERQRAAAKAYRERHPDRIREQNARQRNKDLDVRRAYDAEWKRNKRRERAEKDGRTIRVQEDVSGLSTEELALRFWRQQVTSWQRRRALKKEAKGQYTADDLVWLMERQKGKCAFCLKPFGNKTPNVDHYLPLAGGGTNERANLRLLHETCNKKKWSKHPLDFGLQNGLLCW